MLIEHQYQRGPTSVCLRCKGPQRSHRAREPRQREYCNNIRSRDRIIGIDGEGKGRRPHLYTYLAAADEHGKQWSVANDAGLSSIECFDFLLSLPSRSLCFGFAFLYDLTKICQDMSNPELFSLFHEETRAKIVKGRVIYRAITWKGYRLNYVNRRFSIERGTRHTIVWDVFAFFQSKFTQALINWKIAPKEHLEGMERMKGLRSEFDKLTNEEIHDYCKEECAYLAQLGRRLIDAHDEAQLTLRAFHGAGSTAAAFLKRIDVKSKRGDIPPGMRVPVASAFFGGRFENARLGPIRRRVYNYDISSAYPYQCTFLPCLSCGRWRHTRGFERGTERLALVHWTHPQTRNDRRSWGTLPVRTDKVSGKRYGVGEGVIMFPLAAEGGWTWREEFLAAQKLDGGLDAVEAWVYETDCTHRPFETVPEVYRERLNLGKDAAGLVLKLGLNSIYGKLAQSKGINPPFQSWVWAGNITSGCRAQLLEALTLVPLESMLMFATDGAWSMQPIAFPPPRDTGTFDARDKDTGKLKPLGGWEEKVFDRGVFCVRPGIYFPLEPTEDELEKVRARGLGRRLLYEQYQKIVDAWDNGETSVKLTGVSRFVGAKTGFSVGSKKGLSRRRVYGEWVSHDVECSFDPKPKRQSVNGNELTPWAYFDAPSAPYDRAISDEGMLMAIAAIIAEEQPNVDFGEIE